MNDVRYKTRMRARAPFRGRIAVRAGAGFACLVWLVRCSSSSPSSKGDNPNGSTLGAVDADAGGDSGDMGGAGSYDDPITKQGDSGGSGTDVGATRGDGSTGPSRSEPLADSGTGSDSSEPIEPGDSGKGGSAKGEGGAAGEPRAIADGGVNEGSPGASDDGGDKDGFGADAGPVGNACIGGPTYPASDAAGSHARVSGFGFIDLVTAAEDQIVELDTTLTVPAKPPASGTLFLWPGLQPDGPGSMDLPINNGVLQPVLTWGTTCAPNAPNANAYRSWWISAQYVNTYLSSASPDYAAYGGCHGGQGIDVAVGDSLNISMRLIGTDWSQTVTDARSGESVDYAIDMLGQKQDVAEFDIEGYSQAPVSDVVFTSTALTFASSEPSACQPNVRGANDYFSETQASADGLRCCIPKLILRAQGVAPTSPNSP